MLSRAVAFICLLLVLTSPSFGHLLRLGDKKRLFAEARNIERAIMGMIVASHGHASHTRLPSRLPLDKPGKDLHSAQGLSGNMAGSGSASGSASDSTGNPDLGLGVGIDLILDASGSDKDNIRSDSGSNGSVSKGLVGGGGSEDGSEGLLVGSHGCPDCGDGLIGGKLIGGLLANNNGNSGSNSGSVSSGSTSNSSLVTVAIHEDGDCREPIIAQAAFGTGLCIVIESFSSGASSMMYTYESGALKQVLFSDTGCQNVHSYYAIGAVGNYVGTCHNGVEADIPTEFIIPQFNGRIIMSVLSEKLF
jgi:hypothetical protein